MEPVAPSTVTLRTAAEAEALLLRKGTALIVSPNHNSTPDAIHAATQNSEYCGHDDGRHVTVKPIHQPAMARDDVA
jgi:hypothetical protein